VTLSSVDIFHAVCAFGGLISFIKRRKVIIVTSSLFLEDRETELDHAVDTVREDGRVIEGEARGEE
jgi:hypothetical protein